MQSQDIIFFLDKIGILAFAFTGVAAGVRKKLDIFGLLVVGVSSAIGGGILRDVLIARIPYAISNIDYLVFAFGASVFSIILFYFKINIPTKILHIADTFGLGVFAAAGAAVSLNLNLSIFHTVLFSIVTAAGGGLIRDVFINEIPFVLKRDLYATAAGLGGVIIHSLRGFGFTISESLTIGILIVIGFRLVSIHKNLHLPIINSKP